MEPWHILHIIKKNEFKVEDRPNKKKICPCLEVGQDFSTRQNTQTFKEKNSYSLKLGTSVPQRRYDESEESNDGLEESSQYMILTEVHSQSIFFKKYLYINNRQMIKRLKQVLNGKDYPDGNHMKRCSASLFFRKSKFKWQFYETPLHITRMA